MKHLLLITMLAIAVSCGTKEPKFQVIVEPSCENPVLHQISFTNDGWQTKEVIHIASERGEIFTKLKPSYRVEVIYEPYLGLYEDMRVFSKRFKSYDQCVAHNIKALITYREFLKRNEQ